MALVWVQARKLVVLACGWVAYTYGVVCRSCQTQIQQQALEGSESEPKGTTQPKLRGNQPSSFCYCFCILLTHSSPFIVSLHARLNPIHLSFPLSLYQMSNIWCAFFYAHWSHFVSLPLNNTLCVYLSHLLFLYYYTILQTLSLILI